MFLKVFLLTLYLLLPLMAIAQTPKTNHSQNIVQRSVYEISGIVQDTTEAPVGGAMIMIKSGKDSLRTNTTEDGIFIFKDVPFSSFILSVRQLGFIAITIKSLNSDKKKTIVLDPITLYATSTLLNEVNIRGIPGITYKTDTVEYRASDYLVRNNSHIDDLLKSMEGMEVGQNGTLNHNGEQVKKAKLNGKEFGGGDVPQAIKNLPADIVDKIQIVDDYGEQASRTGIKNGPSIKTINITTKSDKSSGHMGSVTADYGSNNRYNENLFYQHINGNDQFGIIGKIENTINGVADNTKNSSAPGPDFNNNSSPGSGGTTTSKTTTINYRKQLSRSVLLNSVYGFGAKTINTITNSVAQNFSNYGTTFTQTDSEFSRYNNVHNFKFELDINPDPENYIQIVPAFTYIGLNNKSTSQDLTTGLINRQLNDSVSTKNAAPVYGGTVFFQHLFKKKGRNVSIESNIMVTHKKLVNSQNNQILFKNPWQELINDSLVNRGLYQLDANRAIKTNVTFIEPLSVSSQLEFNTGLDYERFSYELITDNKELNGEAQVIDSLTNFYQYSFTQINLAMAFTTKKPKYNFTIGIKAYTTMLNGRHNLYIAPVFRFQYSLTPTQQFSLNYQGSPLVPQTFQIQPAPNYLNPTNPVFGNPELNPSFSHNIGASYNNYMANSKINISSNVKVAIYQNQVVNNNILRVQPMLGSYLMETHFANLNGSYALTGNYNLAKQLNNRKYNFELNGTIQYGHFATLNNNLKNYYTNWRMNQRFGPRINASDNIEINPYISYDIFKSENTLPDAIPSSIKTIAVNIEGYFQILKKWRAGYSAYKNFIKGIDANISKNPFVVNASLQRELFMNRNGILKIQIFDLFKQNNFINRIITENSITDIRSNSLSRYFLVGFVLNLQKWGGTPTRKGKVLKRKNDGSFIY